MINANELRLGNFVEYLGSFHKAHALNNRGTALKLNISEYLVFIDNGVINPIPITLEILEKCGFLKGSVMFDGSTEYYITDKIYLWFSQDQYELNYNEEYGGGTYAVVKYLHQLQNLYFALTGEELTIDL